MISHENIRSLMTCCKSGRRIWKNGSQYTLYCFSFHSSADESAFGAERSGGRCAAQVCGPTCIPAAEIFFFRRRNHRDGACHLFYRATSRRARRFPPPASGRNPSLFRRSWPGVMCRSGFSCVVYPPFVTTREKEILREDRSTSQRCNAPRLSLEGGH